MGGLEQFGDIGPKALAQVPNEKPSLNAEGYTKLSVAEALSKGLTAAERTALKAIASATSLMEVREGIDSFNRETSPKDASELGLSLENMEIINHPITLDESVYDFPDDAQVVLNRTKQGVMSIRIIDTPKS